MLPTLREGWKLQIRSLPAKDLRVGDIGIFVHRGILTIHRLVWKLEADGREWYMFQGDNNPQRETVEADAVLGRVEAAEWEESRPGGPISTPVGKDGRAFFYRTAFRVHSFIASLIPSVALPAKGRAGSFPYRCLRACFRLLEPLFSPRPRG
jgi:hypothetical protein